LNMWNRLLLLIALGFSGRTNGAKVK